MDEIKFIAINTQSLWEKGTIDNLSIGSDGVRLKNVYEYKFRADIIDDPDIVIHDIVVDECGIIYFIAHAGGSDSIYACTISQGDLDEWDSIPDKRSLSDLMIKGKATRMGCMPGILPVSFVSPSGIGIDMDTIYIAESSRVIALARNNLQIRWILSESQDGKLEQVSDISADLNGNIYALETGKNRILKITRGGRISRVVDGKLSNPTDIAIDVNGAVYVLDEKGVLCDLNGSLDRVYQFKTDKFSPKGLASDASGNIFTGTSDTINPTIYRLNKDQDPFPLWSYRDATGRLANDATGNLYVINGKGNKLTFLEYAKVNQEVGGAFSGTYTSWPMDSHNPKNRWHRFLLEGEFPKGTQVEFSYFIANELRDIDTIGWKMAIPGTSSVQGEKIRDVLFQEDIEGRYLWFRINLTGTEGLSPAINSIRIFFPRSTYINYLPAIYQEDPGGKDFLERFLSIFESIFSEIEYDIEHISRFFDAVGTPPDFLSWLGSWLSIPEEESFPENMKRLYILKAISLYKKRGTKEGIEEAIAYFLYTKKHPDIGIEHINEHYQEEKPFIIENFRSRGSGLEVSRCQGALYIPPDDTLVKIKKPDKLTWNDGEEKVSERLMKFLGQVYGSVWVKERILKVNNKTIQIIINNQIIKLNDANTKIDLDLGKTGTEGYYNVHIREEKGLLKIYESVPLSDVLFGKKQSGSPDVLFRKERFSFCVFLKIDALNNDSGNATGINGIETGLRTVRRIIEEQKPAHTCYGLRVLEPWFYLDMHTYLGVNTYLTKSQFVVGKTSVIGRDMVLDDPELSGQVERHSRAGIDTRLT